MVSNRRQCRITSQSTTSEKMDINSNLVQEVLAVAESIISANRVLDAKLLYDEVRKRQRVDPKALLAAINFLMARRILVEGSKLTKELVLSNLHRKNIFDYIRSKGSAKFSAIRDAYEGTTGSSGQLIWHLQILLKFNYIKKLKFKRFTIFLPQEIDEAQGLIYFLTQDPLNQKILKLLYTQGPQMRTDFYEAIDAPREKIHYRVKVLLEMNLISPFGGSDKELCLNPGKAASLSSIIKQFNEEGGPKHNDPELDP
jgi:predicted transcriptional regulator